MKIFSVFVLVFLFTSNQNFGQQNNLVEKKSIGKFKILVEELPNFQFNAFIVDTISNNKIKINDLLYSKYQNIGNFLLEDTLMIFIAEAPKMSDPSGTIELVRLKIGFDTLMLTNHFHLYGALNPGGMIVPNQWYCFRNYKIIDPDHLECIENWWMLKSDKTKEYDNLKTTWKIDYPNRTIIKLSEIKIE